MKTNIYNLAYQGSCLLWLIIGIITNNQSAIAQLIPDNTLGVESSTIVNNGLKDTITGGATRGTNLFHSFQKFNIDAGKSVYFSQSSNIQNILTRVTGSNTSNIFGKLGVEGNANLFLINPSGIIFGNGASLDIKGSLIASTAKSIKFVDGTEFSTQVSTQMNQPLLTITAPLGLQFTNNPGKINIESQKGLQIQPDQTLAFIGGDINLVGTQIETSGGRIELGSVNQAGLVNLIPINQGFLLEYNQINNFGNIQLSGGTNIDTSGITAGEIRINTGNLQMIEGSKIVSLNEGSLPGGAMIINATNTVEMIGTGEFEKGFADILNPNINHTNYGNGFFALTVGTGNGGNFEINTGKLILKNGVFIVVSAVEQGKGGDININTTNLEINNSLLTTGNRPLSSGNAGNISINTATLRVENVGIIATSSFGTGKAGNITINATKLMEMIGGTTFINLSIGTNINTLLTSETFGISDAGNIQINTQKLILENSYIVSSSETGSIGNGGNLTINTNSLQLINGGSISGSTSSSGKAGNLIVNASDIQIIGMSQDDAPSGLFARSRIGATGSAGDIKISTNNLEIHDGAAISTSTFGSGNGGHININANTFTADSKGKVLTTTSGSGLAGNIYLNISNSLNLDGTDTGLFANTEIGSTGKSGSIIIDPTVFMIKNGAGVGVNSQGSGQGGSISIQSGMLTLDNQAFINASSASNEGGEITLNIKDLLWLRNNSNITATAGTAGAGGNGGNININAPFIIGFASENSDITANAFEGNGGQINITTNTIFGLKFQPQQTDFSDITASSQFGLSGQVTINRLDVDPAKGLLALPSNLVDNSNQLAQGCSSNSGKIARQQGRFSIAGKGGLPSHPNDLFTGTIPLLDLVDIQPTKTSQESVKPVVINNQNNQNNQKVNLKNREIQQAQGWVFTDDGKVILTAQTSQTIPQNTSLNNPGCEVFSQ